MRTFSDEETKQWLLALDRRVSSAAAWLETTDGRLVVIKSDYKEHWTPPGGLVDQDEMPREAVRREVMEEVGITLPLDAYDFVTVAVRRLKVIGMNYQFIFRATVTDLMVANIVPLAGEAEDYALVTRQDILAGDRLYAPSVIAWAKGIEPYFEID